MEKFVTHIRKRLNYANVMSSIAVFLVIGGATAFAALAKNSVGTKQLKKNAVTTKKIKKGAVTRAKIKNGAVNVSKLSDGAVTNSKLTNAAVTNSRLAEGAVTNSKLADDAVTGSKIAAGSVGRDDIAGSQFIPRAYALVDLGGEVFGPLSDGIPNASTPSEGIYCFDLQFTPIHAQATARSDLESNDLASVDLASAPEGLPNCPATSEVEVVMWDIATNKAIAERFWLVVW